MMLMEQMEEESANEKDPSQNVQVEVTQGRSRGSGKLQHALLKSSTPIVHCQYEG